MALASSLIYCFILYSHLETQLDGAMLQSYHATHKSASETCACIRFRLPLVFTGVMGAGIALGAEPLGLYERRSQAPMIWLSLHKQHIPYPLPKWT